MKNRFILYRRDGGIFYCEDTNTKKQQSLRTKDENEAKAFLAAKNEAVRQPAMNLQMAQVYLQHADPALSTRTWQHVMEKLMSMKTGPTRERWEHAIQDKAFDIIRSRPLVQTSSEHFLDVLNKGTVSTNVFLRRAHNFAVGMHWLPWPVLPKLQWPPVQYKDKRAVTVEEHERIIAREKNPEMNAYLRLLWHTGGSQTDVAVLNAEDVDWNDYTISFNRRKTGTLVCLTFGTEAAEILQSLPKSGPLFPRLAKLHEKHRAKLFAKRLATLNIKGISLHSYRYSWAERAKESGYPERYAMQALGHSSKAVHRSYSKKAKMKLPSLEEFEKKVIPLHSAEKKAGQATATNREDWQGESLAAVGA